MSQTLHVALMRVFGISICPTCGQRKMLKTCFCKTCYFALPQKMRLGLYASALDGDEFFDSYLSAMEHLIKMRMAVPPEKWPLEAQRMFDETGLTQALDLERRKRACLQK